MSDKLSYDTVIDLLMGDMNTERDFEVALNFLGHTTSVIRHMYWHTKIKNKYTNTDTNLESTEETKHD